MSAFKTVFDFLKDVPKNQNHEELYLDKVKHASLYRDKTDISLVDWEGSVVGFAEGNILCGLGINNKFTLSGMLKKIPIVAHSLAKQRDDPDGATSKKNKVTHMRQFATDRHKYLGSAKGRVLYPNRPGICVERDAVLKGRLQSAMPNLSAKDMADVILVNVGEKMNINTDMRHVFAKGYLLLCDYNLAAASKHKERLIDNDWGASAKHGATSMERLLLMAAFDLVVDADIFTPSERALLNLMCAPYPTVKYAGDNVYTTINMEEDHIVWVSSQKVVVTKEYSFGSPDRMYHDMVEIANKMGCLEDMRVAFRDMRGLPFLVDKVCQYSGKDEFPMKYPKSFCMRNALGERDNWTTHIVQRSNYLSTTKALIAELLLGEVLAYSIFAVGEELGAYGKVGCLTGDHRTDPVFNSNCRDYGLKHEDERVNILLQEWRAAKNHPMIIGFRGSLKTCVINIAQMIASNEIKVKDVCMPQVGFEMPFSNCKNTAWAVVKGYNPRLARFKDGYAEVHENAKGRAFKFMMGVRDSVPMVGYNAFGLKQNEVSSYSEMEFDAIGAGDYKITCMDYYIGCDVTPRTDEMEMAAIGIHYTRYKGTRCTVVADPSGEEYILPNMTNIPGHAATTGKQPVEEGQADTGFKTVHTVGGSTINLRADMNKLLEKQRLTFASIQRDETLRIRPLKSFSYGSDGRKLVNPSASDATRYLYPRQVEDLKEGNYKMTRVPTSGEGLLCGVRAIGQDLVSHGLLPANELDTFIRNKSNDLIGAGNFNSEQLAASLNGQGLGVTILAPHTDGGLRAHNYGTRGNVHNVILYNDGGHHYENVLLGEGDMTRVSSSMAGLDPSESAERIEQIGYFVVTA